MTHTTTAPTISIVLPTYNRAHLLERAIRSALTQTFDDWELLIVDDGSTDRTEEVVRSYHDPRFRYIRRDRNYGLLAARNTGIRSAAAGPFIAFLDDDDEWLPRKLEKQLEVFRNGPPTLAVVGCGRVTHSRRNVKTVLPQGKGWMFEDLLAGRATGCGTPLLLVKRFPPKPDFLFDEEFPAMGERDYLMRIARQYTMDFVAEPLINVYRNHDTPHAANPRSAVKAYAMFLKKYACEIEARPAVRRYYQVSIARELASIDRVEEARRCLAEALTSCRRDPKLYVWFAATFLGSPGVYACSRVFPIRPPKVAAPEAAMA
jgi:glycosyltransferase involved in cell wall biosynthesis